MYQPTSWEYVQFLYLANDQESAFLGQEGVNMLDAWLHTGMAEPYTMATITWTTTGGEEPPPTCAAPTPNLLSAISGNQEVLVDWSNEHSADPSVTGYQVYYDQAGKAQLITSVGLTTSYLDIGLTNGQEYCYKVTTLYKVDGTSRG